MNLYMRQISTAVKGSFMRIFRPFAIALVAVALFVPAVSAQWPTTCVELNDIVESHLGNAGNIGIYQKVFGEQAEQACRNDHRNDVRSVFAWAIGDEPATQPTTQPVVAPPPPPTYADPYVPSVKHRSASQPSQGALIEVAESRGASRSAAIRVAKAVQTSQTERLFVVGLHTGIEYGVDERAVPLRSNKAKLLTNAPENAIGFWTDQSRVHNTYRDRTEGAEYSKTFRVTQGTYRVAFEWKRNLDKYDSPTDLGFSLYKGYSGGTVVREVYPESQEVGFIEEIIVFDRDAYHYISFRLAGGPQIEFRFELLRV